MMPRARTFYDNRGIIMLQQDYSQTPFAYPSSLRASNFVQSSRDRSVSGSRSGSRNGSRNGVNQQNRVRVAPPSSNVLHEYSRGTGAAF